VAISVQVSGDRYQVSVSPPQGPPWQSAEALTATEVLEKLSDLGCHSTDITDALYAANPDWGFAHGTEVGRRRAIEGDSDA